MCVNGASKKKGEILREKNVDLLLSGYNVRDEDGVSHPGCRRWCYAVQAR